MTGLISKLKNLLLRRKQAGTTSASRAQGDEARTAVLNKQLVIELMKQLEQTREGQFSCADSYALLDEYADLIVDDQEAELLMPLVKAHIDACPDCHQEFEVLLDILRSAEG